jgi:hypothetical protein
LDQYLGLVLLWRKGAELEVVAGLGTAGAVGPGGELGLDLGLLPTNSPELLLLLFESFVLLLSKE